ncbi:MAG: YceI family protein [Bacteroidota bacterium]
MAALFVLLTGFVKPRNFMMGNEKKWLISESSSLSVNGTTNINKFACDIPAYDQTDTLTLSRGNKEIILSGDIRLKIQSFDCHNSIMTHDLRKTLKEKEFPRLHIRFLSLSDIPELTIKPAMITGFVDIELAGAAKRFQVNYQVSIDAQKNIHLLGSRDINFSDFNLIPPRKLGGMIKTNDKLSVAFHLKMKALN